ncbi:MAG TPA: TonB-dependent receptor plug domain-containing protein [Opitutaceae bacterium]|nr:TonB-dependent receptor [Opitutaceae bacterium]HRE06407.1 TonB-dependent receptor plug domain-containing protein [Opitutaceae bacterium]
MKYPATTLAGAAALALLLLAAPASGQLAPTPGADLTKSAETSEEIVQLSPFAVTAQSGWSANDTLSATRTKQALKDVPVSIDAITSDFMEDLNLGTADEVMSFVAGVFAPGVMENDGQQDVIAFRGLSQRGNVSRNYFRWYAPSDTYNVERIDFGKGSNSLIFGEVEPGGQGAVFTKRAQMRNFGRVYAQYNSEEAYRLQLDVNRKLRDNLAFRVNAVKREDRTFQDASTYGLEGAHATITWQPFKNTQIRLEGEIGDFENARGFAGVFVRETSARSRAFSSAGTYFTSDNQWIIQSTLPAADRASGNNPGGGSPSLLEGGYFDVIMRNAAGQAVGTKRLNGLPKEYNIRGSFDRQARPFDTHTIVIEQRVGPVAFELAYNHQNQQAERTDNFFSNTISVDVNGRPYIDTTLDQKRFGTETDAFRFTAVYNFDRWKWMQQLIVVSGEYLEDQQENVRWQYFNVAPVNNGTRTSVDINNDRGRLRVYLDDPQFYSRALFERMKPAALPVTSTVDMQPLRLFAAGGGSTTGTSWRQAAAFSGSMTGRYFKGRLQSLLGVRRDFNRLWEYQGTRVEGKYREEIFPPNRRDAAPGDYLQNFGQRAANTTLSGGLTFAVSKDLNVYAAYGESFRFQDALTFDRIRFDPIKGKSKEVGVKGDFWEGRANVSVGVFEIDRENVVLSWNNVLDVSRDDLEDLMNPNNILPGDPAYKYAADGTNSASRNYASTESSKGADLTLMVRPLPGLQLRFTVARAKVAGTPDLANFRAYYQSAVSRGNESPALLNEAKNLLDTLDLPNRPTGARAAEWSASWIVDYAFSRNSWAPLKGVRMGANGSWRDDYLFGINNGQELVGGGTHLVSAYVMRDQKIFGHRVRVRAGVKNLTDLENGDIRKTSFTTLSSGANVYRYSYVMPPQYDLSVTMDF